MTPFTKTARSAALGLALAVSFISLAHGQESVSEDSQARDSVSTNASHQMPTNWNDTSIGMRYARDFYFPGSDQKVTQRIGTLNTVGGFKLGSYMFNVDYLVSDGNNPEANGTQGAQEVYSVGHIDWSASKILGRPVSFGVIRDVGFRTGYEFSSKNDAYGSRARMLVLGPAVEFAVPRGYWNLMAGMRTESNYNGITHANVEYDNAWHIESSWMLPFNVGRVPTVFKGFLSMTGPKGADGFHVQTKTETLARMAILFDVGAIAGYPKTFYMGPGYEFWNNMFGTPPAEAKGTHRSAPTLVAEFHF